MILIAFLPLFFFFFLLCGIHYLLWCPPRGLWCSDQCCYYNPRQSLNWQLTCELLNHSPAKMASVLGFSKRIFWIVFRRQDGLKTNKKNPKKCTVWPRFFLRWTLNKGQAEAMHACAHAWVQPACGCSLKFLGVLLRSEQRSWAVSRCAYVFKVQEQTDVDRGNFRAVRSLRVAQIKISSSLAHH